MPLAQIGLLDLASVTRTLIELLEQWRDESPLRQSPDAFKIDIKGTAPDAGRENAEGDCLLSLYLFHVEQDKFQRNSPVTGSRVPAIPAQPLSLNLYYLLSAYAKKNYEYEQQAMSIALRCFHENPFVRTSIVLDSQPINIEFCLTMEAETIDEVGRLWQAITVPMRLAVVYKVSVVFIAPEAPPAIPSPPTQWTIKVDPLSSPFVATGQVLGTFANLKYIGPDHKPYNFSPAPAVVAPQQRFFLYGKGLNIPDLTDQIYLLKDSGTESEVSSSWIHARDDTRVILSILDNTLPPGLYQLRVGHGDLNQSGSYRSNATPFSLSAFIDPSGDPVVSDGLMTLHGSGLITGQTEVMLNRIPLTEKSSGTVGAGEFQVAPDGTSIQLQPPSNLPKGQYAIRIRVNQVESLPAKWVVKT